MLNTSHKQQAARGLQSQENSVIRAVTGISLQPVSIDAGTCAGSQGENKKEVYEQHKFNRTTEQLKQRQF